MNVKAFVPARGGSTRVVNKNMRDIGGIPLFLRACYNLHQVLPKNDIILDSDNEDYLQAAGEHGFRTIVRPHELATNEADGNAFFRWETSNFPDADVYIQHLPPMPFLSKDTLMQALDAVTEGGYDSIVCVGEEQYYLWDREESRPLYDLASIPNSFDLIPTVFETMGFYVIRGDAHRKTGLRIGGRRKFISVNKFEQVDINYPEDYELAAAIERGLGESSPYKSRNLLRGGIELSCFSDAGHFDEQAGASAFRKREAAA